MTENRPFHRIAGLLVGALVAASNTALAQNGNPLLVPVDENPTSALPFANPGRVVASILTLERGLASLAAGDVDSARAARDALGADTLDHHILSWTIALRAGNKGVSDDILHARALLPGWPAQSALQRNLERALLREGASPQVTINALGNAQAMTIDGAILKARAKMAAGDRAAAAAALSDIWRKSRLDAETEAKVIAEFGPIIAQADHRFRMERMLYSERVQSAAQVAALAGAPELAAAWSAVIDDAKDASSKMDAVPREQRGAGYVFAKAQLLRKSDRREEAAELMISGPASRIDLVDADKQWESRRVLARQLFDAGKPKLAYKLVATHSGESTANQIDAEFHAGWYALRALKEPDRAAYHFARIAEMAEGPISRARAYYWLGRVAEAGGKNDARFYYEKAAVIGTTFYGQLAAEKLGRHAIDMDSPVPSGADRKIFPEREAVRALARLNEAGYPQFADTLYLALADQLTSPGELGLLASMAQAKGNHYLALKVGKIAAQRGIDVGTLTHPIGAIPIGADISGSGKALAYAIARQESEFNVGAVSQAGALGLLQLMPATAAEVAAHTGVSYSKTKLTTDAGYNAELGAAFLGQQLDRFGGSYILTFIGYNAGPRRADQWIARYGDPRGKDLDDVVDWIERIPFTETRSYVQRVMENYQVYKMRLSGKVDIAGDLRHGRS